jgi:hypothetical protein
VKGPGIIARTLSTPSVVDKAGNHWQYHPRSDRHSKIACWAVLFDLMQASSLLQRHVRAGKVTFGINRQLNDWETGKKKDLDLVVARTPGPGGQPTGRAFDLKALAAQYNVLLSDDEHAALDRLPIAQGGTAGATVLVALEAKACMTAHVRALPRLYDELTSSHSTVHGDNSNALSVGFVMVNLADEFVSPDRNRALLTPQTPVEVSQHRQPHATERTIAKMKEIRRRPGPGSGRPGFDALGIMVVSMRNDGSPVNLITTPPAPGATSEYHYAQMIGRAAHLYDSNFGHI